MESLHDLFVDQLQDLYSAEKQIIDAIPKMIEKAQSADLRSALNMHLDESREQLRRLDRIFDQMPKVDREDKKCKGIKGIIDEGEDTIKNAKDADTRDAGIIAGAQRVEHYEMSAYGTARTYARLLGHPEWEQVLRTSEDEEKMADRKLNSIAERVNVEARAA